MGHRADIAAGVAATDFAARLDHHHAERGVIHRQAVGDQSRVPGFEDSQGQFFAGQHRPLERKHRDGRHG